MFKTSRNYSSKTLRHYSSKPAARAVAAGAVLVGRVEEVAGVGQASNASRGRQQRAHGVDVEEGSKPPRAAAAHHNFSGRRQAASARK